jgi:hypothetical protein
MFSMILKNLFLFIVCRQVWAIFRKAFLLQGEIPRLVSTAPPLKESSKSKFKAQTKNSEVKQAGQSY